MSKKPDGFLESVLKNIDMHMAVEASRDKNGKIDPYKAAGIAAGKGAHSFEDMLKLGAILGSKGAFDDKD